jgi:hypothetical protein
MKHRSRKGALAGAVFTSLVSFGCAGGLTDGPTGAGGTTGTGGAGGAPACVPQGGTTTPPATFTTVKAAMVGFDAIESCAANPCHPKFGMAPPDNPLVLQQDMDLYRNMTAYVSKACGNIPFVNPGKPNESALIKIISGPCGNTPRMPFQCNAEEGQCLPPDWIAAISQWIANCAPEN